MIQRDIIYNLLKDNRGRWMETMEIMKLLQYTIKIAPIRRCLQELLARGKVDTLEGYHDYKTGDIIPAKWRVRF